MFRLTLPLIPLLMLAVALPPDAQSQPLPKIPEPVVMSLREIRPPESLPGQVLELDFVTSKSMSLFIPQGFVPPENGAVELTMHFHGAHWFAVEEHLRRGLDSPLLTFELGQGSTVYKTPFLDESQFLRTIKTVESTLQLHTGNPATHVAVVDISSYSAGYGAVREMIKSPQNVKLIRRIVLGDSLYGSLDSAALENGLREPAAEHVEPWVNFGRLALAGEKTLFITTSEITPEAYAGSHEVARSITKALGLEIQSVKPGSSPAAETMQPYPLVQRAGSAGFHWWGYAGEDATAHMTLARHIADYWIALDEAGIP